TSHSPCGNAVCTCPVPERDAGRCCCTLLAAPREVEEPQPPAHGCPRCHKSAAPAAQAKCCSTHSSNTKWRIVASRCGSDPSPATFPGQLLDTPPATGWQSYVELSFQVQSHVCFTMHVAATPPDPPPRG